MDVRSGVGAGANGGRGCRCEPFEGLRNMGRRRMAKGMRRPHIVVGSHELNSVINRKRVQRPEGLDPVKGLHILSFTNIKSMMVQWSSGYDFCLTHRRSPVRSRIEPDLFSLTQMTRAPGEQT
jgi:hypothetical protein